MIKLNFPETALTTVSCNEVTITYEVECYGAKLTIVIDEFLNEVNIIVSEDEKHKYCNSKVRLAQSYIDRFFAHYKKKYDEDVAECKENIDYLNFFAGKPIIDELNKIFRIRK